MFVTSLSIAMLIVILLFFINKCNTYFTPIVVPCLDLNNVKFKTGDLIFFKACDNIKSIPVHDYYTHVGIVVEFNRKLYLFEAQNTEVHRIPRDPRGIHVAPLLERITRYRGYSYVRFLNKELEPERKEYLYQFVDYALNNMWYTNSLEFNNIKKWLGLTKCGNNTDCSQLVFLSLIKMGLISIEEYSIPILNHVIYLSKKYNLLDGFCYSESYELLFPAA